MSITTEQEPPTKELFGGKKHSFTPEEARKAALKRLENQHLKRLSEQQSITQTVSASAELAQNPDDYAQGRLTRVRLQLDRLDVLLQTESDPARLDRLAAASAKLSEVERQLAGRPLPGSLRPSNRPVAGGMIEQPQTSASGTSSAPPVQSEAQE